MLKILFLQFLFVLRNQALWDNLVLCLSDVQLLFLLNLASIQSDFSRPGVAGGEKNFNIFKLTLSLKSSPRPLHCVSHLG